jgi:hypothetical protein
LVLSVAFSPSPFFEGRGEKDFGSAAIERMITFLLHIGPVNVQLWTDGIFPILDAGEVPISLEVSPKPMVMKLSGPLIGIFIPVYH